VDLPALLQHQGYAEILPFLESLRIRTEEGRVIVDVSARIQDAQVPA
jgi:hypothetical protein